MMVAISIYEGVLFLSILSFANARDVCQDGTGTIGTNNRMEYEEVEEDHSGGKLYLNVDNPAQCNGTITHWEYCYYKPDEQGVYQVHFAVYRQKIVPGNGNVHYRRQSPSFSISVNLDEEVTVPDFVCTSYYKYVTIQQGDFVGICLPQSNSLDVVSDTSDVADRLQYSDCDDDAPGNIANTNNLSEARDRIAHLYAHISSNTGETIPITNSRSEPPTANATPDQPQTEPDSDMSIRNPSQFLTTSSLMRGQPSSSSIIVPTAETSTATTVNIQPATSTSVENSVRSQMPIIPRPTSTGETMLSRTYTFTSTTTTIDTQPVVTVISSVISTKKLSLMSTPLVFSTQTSTVALLLPTSTTKTTTLSISIEPPSPDQSVTVLSSSKSILMATIPPGPQNLEQGSLSTVATVIIILVVLTFVVLTAALIGILAQRYRKRRYRYYPAFKHTILEEDESSYSQTDTIARFDNVLYSNYTETVQIQDARKSGQVYDYCDSSTKSPEPQTIENTYSEVQEEVDSDSYSYAVISGELHAPVAKANSRLPEQRPYDPNRESLLSVFCAPASKESDLYAQLKLCGVKNIRRDTIEATENLGSGQFGDVKKGIWRNEKLKVSVALKTLKEGSEQVDKVKFLQEAAIMAQFSHPNVAVLYGVVSKGEPIILVVELVKKGNLFDYLAFLKENNDSVHLPNLPNTLLNFSRQVSLGMRYLSEKGFVHRDLAARNILVSSDDICKIADFGMSRDLADENYYVSHGGKIPVKWTAPEAINYKKYSTASDVWSYGCLLYEIWSLGHKPYENLSNIQVIRHLELGERLSPPPGCPRKIYEIMIFCWNPEVAFRPKFSDLTLILVGDRKEVLAVPQEDLATHPLAGVLGAPLDAGEGMYLDLQNRYVFN